jgi:AraC-like DNA-binding protein
MEGATATGVAIGGAEKLGHGVVHGLMKQNARCESFAIKIRPASDLSVATSDIEAIWMTSLSETPGSTEAMPSESALLPRLTLPPGWASLVRVHDLLGEITISCFDGVPNQALDVQASGPAMFCIGIFVAGSARMSLDKGESLNVGPGMAVVQTAAQTATGRFSMAGGQPIQVVDIRFSPAGLSQAGGRPLAALQGQFVQDRSLPHEQSLLGGFPAPPALLGVARDILCCQFDEAALSELYLRAKALEALALVLQAMRPVTSPRLSRERRQLLQARQLLDDRYDEDWSLARLAREVGLNEKKLQAGFRAMVGHTVHAHLHQSRMEAAAAMLARGMAVTEVGLAVGFTSPSHFTKTFRRSKGLTPKEWRARREEL